MEKLGSDELAVWDLYAAGALNVVAARILDQGNNKTTNPGLATFGGVLTAEGAAKLAASIADQLLEERRERKHPISAGLL
ncbi:hypothetical protein D9M71_842130 [compost metagenome]